MEVDGPAGGQVQLVGGYHSQTRVLEFPPPLVSDDVDIEDGPLLGSVDVVNGLGGGDEGNQEHDGRNHRPGDLDKTVPEDLSRLACLPRPGRVADDRGDDDAAYQGKDDGREDQYDPEEI